MSVTFLPAKKSLSNLDCSSGWNSLNQTRENVKPEGDCITNIQAWAHANSIGEIYCVYPGENDRKGKNQLGLPPKPQTQHQIPKILRTWTPNAAHFACLPNQAHLIQIITSLVKTPRCEMGLSDKADIQHVQTGDG